MQAIMPRYFFDTDDGDREFRDDAGIDLGSIDDIPSTTRDLLFDLGYAEVLGGKDRVFTATVRDEQGTTVYSGSVVLKINFDRRTP